MSDRKESLACLLECAFQTTRGVQRRECFKMRMVQTHFDGN